MAIGGDNPDLPAEIIIDILKRLPVKSLLRFRSVCKDWASLLKSPCFIAEHYRHSTHNNPLLIFCEPVRKHRYSPLRLLRYKKESVEIQRTPAAMDPLLRHVFDIVGSCNGLVCAKLYDEESQLVLLLNPATREAREVPGPGIDGSPNIGNWGFGFSPVVRDYKIVRIRNSDAWIILDESHVDGVEVYSLRTGSWKQIEFDAIRRVIIDFASKPVAVDGAIFWAGWRAGDYLIVSFDLAMEVFTLIPLPPNTPTPQIKFDAYENKFAMLHSFREFGNKVVELWVLEEKGSGTYGKSWDWTKKYSIGPLSFFLKPMCCWRNEIVCLKDTIWDRDTIFKVSSLKVDSSYHLVNLTTDNELKEFGCTFSSHNRISDTIFNNYAESLVSMCDDHVA